MLHWQESNPPHHHWKRHNLELNCTVTSFLQLECFPVPCPILILFHFLPTAATPHFPLLTPTHLSGSLLHSSKLHHPCFLLVQQLPLKYSTIWKKIICYKSIFLSLHITHINKTRKRRSQKITINNVYYTFRGDGMDSSWLW